MKQIVFSVFLLLTTTCITSCRKDYTCTCSKIYKNNTGSNVRNYSVKTYRDSRSGAQAKCNEHISSGSDDTGNYTMNCQIEC